MNPWAHDYGAVAPGHPSAAPVGPVVLSAEQKWLRGVLHGWYEVAHQQRLQAVRWERLRALELSYDTQAREQSQTYTMLQCMFFMLKEHARGNVARRRRAEEAGVAGVAERRYWAKQAERLNRVNRGPRATVVAAELKIAAQAAAAKAAGMSPAAAKAKANAAAASASAGRRRTTKLGQALAVAAAINNTPAHVPAAGELGGAIAEGDEDQEEEEEEEEEGEDQEEEDQEEEDQEEEDQEE